MCVFVKHWKKYDRLKHGAFLDVQVIFDRDAGEAGTELLFYVSLFIKKN